MDKSPQSARLLLYSFSTLDSTVLNIYHSALFMDWLHILSRKTILIRTHSHLSSKLSLSTSSWLVRAWCVRTLTHCSASCSLRSHARQAHPSPTRSGYLQNTFGELFTQHLPTSNFASCGIARTLTGKGHIKGQVSNFCSYPIYIHQAVAKRLGVTGKNCDFFSGTKDKLIPPGETYEAEKETYFDGCSTSRKPDFTSVKSSYSLLTLEQ